MEQRKEPRIKPEMAVRASGVDAEGQTFSQLVKVFDVSNRGARLQGLRQALNVGSTVILQYQGKKAEFKVIRVETGKGRKQIEVGLEIFPSQPDIWSAYTSKLPARKTDAEGLES